MTHKKIFFFCFPKKGKGEENGGSLLSTKTFKQAHSPWLQGHQQTLSIALYLPHLTHHTSHLALPIYLVFLRSPGYENEKSGIEVKIRFLQLQHFTIISAACVTCKLVVKQAQHLPWQVPPI